MATGSVENFEKRIKEVLPPWFGENPELLNAFIKGFATTDAYIYSILGYVEDQMRIQTATGENLDLIACDYFGDYIIRREGMHDDLFRKLLLALLLAPMATRQGVIQIITDITGNVPLIFEPFGGEGGAFYDETFYFDSESYYGGSDPYNFWITVFITDTEKKFGGYDSPKYFYDVETPDSDFYYGGGQDYILSYGEMLELINRIKVFGTVPHLTLTYI